jgi:hypothetical protein
LDSQGNFPLQMEKLEVGIVGEQFLKEFPFDFTLKPLAFEARKNTLFLLMNSYGRKIEEMLI